MSTALNLLLWYSFMDKLFSAIFSTGERERVTLEKFLNCIFIHISFAAEQFLDKFLQKRDTEEDVAINRNNCPKSLRKLFILIIIIHCDTIHRFM